MGGREPGCGDMFEGCEDGGGGGGVGYGILETTSRFSMAVAWTVQLGHRVFDSGNSTSFNVRWLLGATS